MLETILRAAAAEHGDKVALVSGGRSFTYRQLDDLSDAFAGALTSRDISSGDRVTIYAENCWDRRLRKLD